MGSCFGRLLNEVDGVEQDPQHVQSNQSQRQSRRHHHHHRNQVPGLSGSNGSSSSSSQDDDDVPLLSGDNANEDQAALLGASGSSSSSRRHRRRHQRHGNYNQGAASNHLQYFTGAASSSGQPSDSNADIKLAQRVGLIQQLPLIRYDEERKQIARECVICMIEFDTGDMLRVLPCLHTFHEQCIDQWLLKSLTCPSCLEPVDAALLATFATGWSN